AAAGRRRGATPPALAAPRAAAAAPRCRRRAAAAHLPRRRVAGAAPHGGAEPLHRAHHPLAVRAAPALAGGAVARPPRTAHRLATGAEGGAVGRGPPRRGRALLAPPPALSAGRLRRGVVR